MISQKRLIFNLALGCVLTLGLSLSLGSLLADWSPPGSTPPDGNVSPPIYSVGTSQDLTGNLNVLGKLGINNSSPGHELVVRDSDTGGPGIYIWGDGQNAELALGNGSNHWGIYRDDTTNELRFWQGDNRLAINAGGDLEVAGKIKSAETTDEDQDDIVATKGYVDGQVAGAFEADSTCGNGSVEIWEACDDGNDSWTEGNCSPDCKRINYWTNPMYGGKQIGGVGEYMPHNAHKICQDLGYISAVSYNTSAGAGEANFWPYNEKILKSSSAYFDSFSITASYLMHGFYIFSSNSFTDSRSTVIRYTYPLYPYTSTSRLYVSRSSETRLYQPSVTAVISEIWCAD